MRIGEGERRRSSSRRDGGRKEARKTKRKAVCDDARTREGRLIHSHVPGKATKRKPTGIE